VLSDILEAFIANANQLLQNQGIDLSQPIGFAENWEEQGGSRRIDVRPIKARGAGAEFHGGISTELNGNVRKKWTSIAVRCCGLPDPDGNLIKNTDDTERLEQVVIVAMNQAVPGRYRFLGGVWNSSGEVQMYGRCLVLTFEIEQPIADIQPYLAEALVESIQLTATETAQ
jgi:hypothetical protein